MHLSIEKKTYPTLFNNFVWLGHTLAKKRRQTNKRGKAIAVEKLDGCLYYNVNIDIVCVVNTYETRILTGINDLSVFIEARAKCHDHHMLFTYERQRNTIMLTMFQDHDLCTDAEFKVKKLLDLIKTTSFNSDDFHYGGSEVHYASLTAKVIRMMPRKYAFNFLSTADLPSGDYNVRCGENGPIIFDSGTCILVQCCIEIPDIEVEGEI